MSDRKPNLDSLFEAALEIESAQERAAFLDQSCGHDAELRREVERLLTSDQQAGSFLDKPPVVLDAVVVPNKLGEDLAEVLDAGVAAAFGEGTAVVIGNAGRSVLKALGHTLNVPHVVLRESPAAGDDRVVRPKSPEMSQRDPDSRYQLQGEIARGGMGAILKGRDNDLGRDLAIKVLLDQHKDKPEVIQRFVEEAQIGGQLQHPGIAPIYELGQFADKRPFFSMKLVKGETLSRLLADRQELTAERGKFLGIFEQVCQTMAYAHSRGVIHRDLKPANVMVGAFGEVQVMDWGLAKVLAAGGVADEKKAHDQQQGQSVIQTLRGKVGTCTPGTFGTVGSQTQMGSVMGTPAYMPPEQALGEIDNLDERADVFGLGAILCELLTGKPPYIGGDSTQVFRMAVRGNLTECFERLEASGADTELIALTKQCLELEPRDRPRDAGVLAAGVTRYLESVETKLRETEMEKVAAQTRSEESVRRHKLIHAAGTAVTMSLVIGIAASVWQTLRANREATRAEAESRLVRSAEKAASIAKRNAEESERQAKHNERLAIESAMAARKSDAIARNEAKYAKQQEHVARENLIKAEKSEQEATEQRKRADQVAENANRNLYYAQMQLGQLAWREHRGLGHMHELLANWIPSEDSPDRRGWEWFYLNSLPFQNLRTLTEGWHRGVRPASVAWHIPSQRLAEGTPDGLIRIWDVDREQTIMTLHMPVPDVPFWGRNWFAWSPDGSRLAAGAMDGTMHVRETSSGRELMVLPGHNTPVVAVAFSSDGARVAAWGMQGAIKIWDVDTGRLSGDITHPGDVSDGAWSPDNELLVSGHLDGSVTISGTQVGGRIAKWKAHNDGIYRLAWSPDSSRIATSSGNDFFVSVWDVASEKMVLGPLRHSHGICSIAWEANGQRLATGSIDQTIKIWNASTGRETVTLHGHLANVTSLSWGPDGHLASASEDTSVKIWYPIRDQESRVIPGDVRLTSVTWNPNGNWLALAGDDGKIRIWDPAHRKEVRTLDAHDQQRTSSQFGLIPALAWHPGGKLLASAGSDGPGKVWDIASNQEVCALPADHGAVRCVAWSPDGSQLATGSPDGTIRVIDMLKEPPQVRVSKVGSSTDNRSMTLAWSPQGDRLALGTFADDHVEVWDPATGTELARMIGEGGVLTVAWSPDGKRLAAGSAQNVITIWDPDTGQTLATMRGHSDFVNGVAWSPDGTRLASAGFDNTVRIWNPETGEESFVLRGNAGMFFDISWNPDGAQLAAACSDGQIWIWDATHGYERDTTPKALPYIDRAVAAGTARGGDVRWFAESYLRAGKAREALDVVKDDPVGLAKIALKLRYGGDASLADEASTKARFLLEQRRTAEPDNEDVASTLADLLLTSVSWTVLRPTEITSTGGAMLMLQNDGSILASGKNPDHDDYTLIARPGLEYITAIRLDALPDSSLPEHGPGRGFNGNFQLNEMSVFSNGHPVSLTAIVTTYDERGEAPCMIDGKVDQAIGWSVYPRSGQANTALIATQLQRDTHAELRCDFHFAKSKWADHNLGRFRLSVSGDPTAYARERKLMAARNLTDPWAKLAAAYGFVGDQSALSSLLEKRPEAAAGVADLLATEMDWEAAIAAYSRLIAPNTPDAVLLGKRAAAYIATGQWELAKADWLRAVERQPDQLQRAFDTYLMAERWNEAAEFGRKLAERKSDDSTWWIRIAPLIVLCDDEKGYASFCNWITQQPADTALLADRAVKACLLRPGSLDLARLPGDTLARELDEGKVVDWLLPWAWGSRALLAYRSGDAEAAARYAARSVESNPTSFSRAMNLTVLALAQHQLRHPDETRTALDEASQLIARLKADPANKGTPDLLIAEILFREAEATMSE